MRTAASKSLFAINFAAADMEHDWLRGPIDSADPLGSASRRGLQ